MADKQVVSKYQSKLTRKDLTLESTVSEIFMGDLRILRRSKGGFIIIISSIDMTSSRGNFTAGAQNYNWLISKWPENWPNVAGIIDMWRGQETDKILVMSMLEEILKNVKIKKNWI